MANGWIEHVKQYQQSHGCSYREAMSKAKDSYKNGGSIVRPQGMVGFDENSLPPQHRKNFLEMKQKGITMVDGMGIKKKYHKL